MPKKKLTKKQILAIAKSPFSQKRLAEKYQVSASTISEIKTGKRHITITKDVEIVRNPYSKRLTPQEVLAIIHSEATPIEISRSYGLPLVRVLEILRGFTYTDITKRTRKQRR